MFQTHCHNPVVPAYPIWAYYVHGRQRRCQEDPVSLPSGRLEKTTRSSPHHVAQHHPTGSETAPSYAPQSSRFGSELPSVEDDVNVWCYAILSCMPETTTTTCWSICWNACVCIRLIEPTCVVVLSILLFAVFTVIYAVRLIIASFDVNKTYLILHLWWMVSVNNE